MRVELDAVTKGGAFAPLSLSFESGGARLAAAETEQRPTVLGLIASGRMRPDAGQVLLDGTADRYDDLRRRVALLDAPAVCDPAPDVPTWAVVAEELMFAGRRSDRIAARRFLSEHFMDIPARAPIADVAPDDRIRLFMELATLRPGVEGLVLVSPDRHGGSPLDWWRVAEEFGHRGLAVLVIAGGASAVVLEHTATRAEPSESGPPPTARPRRALIEKEGGRR